MTTGYDRIECIIFEGRGLVRTSTIQLPHLVLLSSKLVALMLIFIIKITYGVSKPNLATKLDADVSFDAQHHVTPIISSAIPCRILLLYSLDKR